MSEAVFDGEGGCAEVHVDLDGFHLGGVELEHAEFGEGAVVGVECDHVGGEVGDEEGLSGGVVDQGDEVDDFVDVSGLVLDEAGALDLAGGSGDGVGLEAWPEVFEGVCAEVTFEWVFFVGCAFLSSAGLFSFCHDTILKSVMQR